MLSTLTIAVVVFLGAARRSSASPVFLFEFMNSTGNVAGTVKGAIYGLEYGCVGCQATSVVLTEFPGNSPALWPAFNVSVQSLGSSIHANGWNVSNTGVLTDGSFWSTSLWTPGQQTELTIDFHPTTYDGAVLRLAPSGDSQWQYEVRSATHYNVNNPPSLFFSEENDDPAPVPEPATVILLSLGLVGIAARRWRRR
jgi:hypothetical protein